jgi:hypothetical protein
MVDPSDARAASLRQSGNAPLLVLVRQRCALPHQHEEREHHAAAGQQIAEIVQPFWERRSPQKADDPPMQAHRRVVCLLLK